MSGQAIVKRVHAISSCARDLDGPYPMTEGINSPEAAKKWIKKHTGITALPLKEARRLDCGGWAFFPMRKGSVWWSISLRLDVKEVQNEAAACECRNCRYRDR